MSGGFQVVPESFPEAADRLNAIVQGVIGAWVPVRAQSTAVRFGHGDDLLSPLIEISLNSAVQLIESCMLTTAQHLAEAAVALTIMGERYDEAEAGLQQSFEALDSAAFG